MKKDYYEILGLQSGASEGEIKKAYRKLAKKYIFNFKILIIFCFSILFTNKVSGMKKIETEEFIARSITIHGDKYDYTFVDYKNNSTKVKIICPEHGAFEQVPNSHLRGIGCGFCSGNIKKTTERFVYDAKIIHKDKYDYSLVKYENAKNKIKIICPEHGVFEQIPNRHLNGDGCSKCSYIKLRNKSNLGLENFIKKSKLIHGDKYNYSKVQYKNNRTKVTIICPVHDKFEQVPNSHLNGIGCKKCSGEHLSKKMTKTTEKFIKEAKNIHGDKYDYSFVDYKNTDTKVDIKCKIHGIFSQKPTKHLQDNGCPSCSESKLEKELRKILIKNNINFRSQYGRIKDEFYLNGQTVDFYLPEYKLAIECQGEQHFFPVDFGNKGEEYACEQFLKRILYDTKKYDICKNYGIEILYYINNHKFMKNDYIGKMFINSDDLLKEIKNEKRLL